MVKILNLIESFFLNRISDLTDVSPLGNSHINVKNGEITFYNIVAIGNLESFRSQVKDINQEILKHIQSNYFYKVIRMREETVDKYQNDGYLVYINRIQVYEIEKSPKTAHLTVLKTLKDLYV